VAALALLAQLLMTTKTQTLLTTLTDVKRALTLGPVWCDITMPAANHIIVRNVRPFRVTALDKLARESNSETEWTSRYDQGKLVGFEVQVLEGWRVPERVYMEK